MIYSGHKTEHKHGVGVLLIKQVVKSMMGFHALSDILFIVTDNQQTIQPRDCSSVCANKY